MNMDREQEPLDQDTGLDGDSEQGWYFDLPKGAWERQEQKNRELRDRVLRNIQSEPDRSDPFASRRTSPRHQEEKGRGGLFGLGRRKAEPEKPKETPGGTWRLNRGGANFDNLRPVGGSLAEDPDDYSTEPTVDIQPIPLRIRSRKEPGNGGRPPLQRPDDALAAGAERPPSRWDDAVASPAEGGMLQGMASWGKDAGMDEPDSHDDQHRPRLVLRAVPDETQDDREPAAELGGDAEDAPTAHVLDPEAAVAGNLADSPPAEASESRWGELFSVAADEPAAAQVTPDPVADAPTPSFELKLRRPPDDEAETEPEPDATAPRSRWDEVFSAPAGDAGMLDSMRAWASKPADEEEPAPRRLLEDPDDEQRDHELVGAHATVDDAGNDVPKPKKRGLFSRMLGRKAEEPQTAQPALYETAWLPAADEEDVDTTEATDLPPWLAQAEVDDWQEPEHSTAPALVAEEPRPAAADEEEAGFETAPAPAIAEESDHGGWEPVPSIENEPEPAWMRSEATDEEPETPWMLHAPADEPEDHPLVAGHASVTEPAADIPVSPKKKGLFGRMFGRKEHDPESPANVADESPDVTPVTSGIDWEVPDAAADHPWPTRDDSDWLEPEAPVAAVIPDEPAAELVEPFDRGGWVPSEAPEDEPETPWMLHAPSEDSEDEPLVAAVIPDEPASAVVEPFNQGGWVPSEADDDDDEPEAPWMLHAPSEDSEDEPLVAAVIPDEPAAELVEPFGQAGWEPPEATEDEPEAPWMLQAPNEEPGNELLAAAVIPGEPAPAMVGPFDQGGWEPSDSPDDEPEAPWVLHAQSEEPESPATPAAASDESLTPVVEPFDQRGWEPSEAPEDEPEAPWMLHAPSEEPEDEPLVAGHASVIDPVAEIADVPRKKGLFGRMFGRKEYDPASPANVADESSVWVPATGGIDAEAPDAADHPWLKPDNSDGAEPDDSQSPASAWEQPSSWSARAANRWEPAEPAPLEPPATDEPADEPSALAPAAADANDDFSWDPEPFEPAAVAPLTPVSPAEAMEYSTETPVDAPLAQSDPQAAMPSVPVAAWDDSDWTTAEGLEQHADEIMAEETPPEAIAKADPLAAWEPEEAPAEPPPAAIHEAGVASPSVEDGPEPAADEEPWQAVASLEGGALADTPIAPLAESPSWGADESESDTEQPAAEAPEVASEGSYDDPWATFDFTADRADAPVPATADLAARAILPPNEVEDDPWASFMESRQPEAPAAAEEGAPAPPVAEDDDPWAAIADASGYDPAAPIGLDTYRRATGPRSVPADYTPAPIREAAVTPGPEEDAASLPEWARGGDDDDTILKAFEAHASAELDDERSAFGNSLEGHDEPPAFEELLGEGGNELVSEVTEPESDHNAFSRLQGWAPQRNLAPGEVGAIAQWTAPGPALDPSRGTPEGDEWTFPDDDDDVPTWVLPRTSDESGSVAVAVRRASRTRTLVRELIETGLLALLVFLAVRASFQNFKVDGNSMFPTLEDGQFLIVNKLVYSEVDMDKLSNFVPFVDPAGSPKRNVFHGPQRGDIVVLRDPRKPDTDLIKRVIGLPGETIEIVNDEQNGAQVYINDHLLQEPYLKSKWHDSKPKVEIPEGYYFVMGDNRDYSLDSRSQQVGVVSKDNVIGKAMLSYWPKDKLGLAPNEAGNISEENGRPQLTTKRIGQ